MEKDQAKEINNENIAEAFKALFEIDIEKNKKYSIPIRELYLNSQRVTDAQLSFESISFDQSKGSVAVKIEAGSHQLALRDFMIGQMGEGERALTTITGGIVSHKMLEGSGLATALMQQTDNLVNISLDLFEVPENQEALYVVTDRAKGLTNDRQGWTSYQMQKLGFHSDPEQVKEIRDALGLPIEDDEIEKTFFKVY